MLINLHALINVLTRCSSLSQTRTSRAGCEHVPEHGAAHVPEHVNRILRDRTFGDRNLGDSGAPGGAAVPRSFVESLHVPTPADAKANQSPYRRHLESSQR